MSTSTAPSVVIVGGGIYGTSLAYELAQAGRSVTLLEADEIACGASGGPGERGVRACRRDIRELPVVALSMQRWKEAEAAFEGGVGYRNVGSILVYETPYGAREHETAGRVEAMAAVQDALGTPSVLLTREAMLEREPELSPSIRGGIYCPDDGVGDHTFATRQFAKAATAAGATIRTGARVAEVIAARGAATGVKLASGEVVPVGDELVLLANAGTPALLAPHRTPGEVAPVWNIMPQMLFVTNPDGRTVRHLLTHETRRLAVKQLPDGTMMLSGGVSVTHAGDAWQGSLSAMSLGLTDSIQTFPFLDRSTFHSVDASRVETVSLDGVPIIGRPEALANTLVGYAWCGHGFAIALGFTKHMADWVLTGERPEALAPFSPARFRSPAAAPALAELAAAASA